MSDIEGTGLLALPYVIAQSGLVAIAAMAVVPFIAFYTGAILIDCLYEENDAGERVRVRSNYKQLGEVLLPSFWRYHSFRYTVSGTFSPGIFVPCIVCLAFERYLSRFAAVRQSMDAYCSCARSSNFICEESIAGCMDEFIECDSFNGSSGCCFSLRNSS